MEPALINAAIVMWSGRGLRAWPTRDLSRLAEHFDPGLAADLAALVTQIEEDFWAAGPHGELMDDGKEVATSVFQALHPAISEDALDALWWCYSYDWK